MNADLSRRVSRRTAHRWMAATAASTGLVGGSASRAAATTGPSSQIEQIRTISRTTDLYCGWPTMTRRKNGQLILVWSGRREQHVCPFGRVEMMRSNDQGDSWTWPRTILDGAIDDRDAGVLETEKGTLLVTTFTSLAYQPQLDKQIAMLDQPEHQGDRWPEERLQRWRSVHDRLSAAERSAELGQWMIRSTDGGLTWSERYRSIVNSPHGPTQLADGRLIYAGRELWTGERGVGVCESIDDGINWRPLAKIPTRGEDDPKQYHELHAIEANSGRLIVHIRNHNQTNDRETLQSESDDGGRTWTTPHSIGVWGFPSFLTKLRNGRLLMTYGHRRDPLGIQARLSDDEGMTWSEPMILWGEGKSSDLGYPSTVELDDGSLLSVWYERMAGSKNAVLRQARWRIVD